jgi:hypothetical protein
MSLSTLPSITMPRQEAIRAYREFRQACHGNPTDMDSAVMMGLKALAKGHAIIDLDAAMRAAGVDDRQRPKLAVARASWDFVSYRTAHRNDAVEFFRPPLPRRGRAALAATVARGALPFVRHGFRAAVPYTPPSVRPRQPDDYHILWEAVWEPTTPPFDPFLLRRVRGNLFAVLAVWDLTDLERAVMAQSLAERGPRQ